jgi:hypothetical protein
MKRLIRGLCLGAALHLGATGVASAAMLNFDTMGLIDNQAVSFNGSLFSAYGIQFVGNNGLFSEAVGGQNLTADGDPEGFVSDQLSAPGAGVWDTKVGSGSAGLGNFFLRGPGLTQPYTQPGNPSWPVTTNPLFAIEYLTNPTGAISGEIWDIDGVNNQSEAWVVKAVDSVGNVLQTQTSPAYSTNGSGSLDGAAWLFQFAADPNIERLDFYFVGTKTDGIGVAFDNFESGVVVPLPAALPLLVSALGGFGLLGRRRRTEAIG